MGWAVRHGHTEDRGLSLNFKKTAVEGLFVVSTDAQADSRGHFARVFCEIELAGNGHPFHVIQSSISSNLRAATLRGLHYQSVAAPERKLVRCVRGAVWDVVVDLRPTSETYLKWHGAELSGENLLAFLVPTGCAHGFMTLTDNAEVLYMMDQAYVPDTARGVRWDDAVFSIQWPEKPAVISERDATYPDYQSA